MEKEINIYVSCHKESYIPKNDLLIPIQVGTILADKKFDGMIHDDSGENNISKKNKQYCELTAQYWVWKNSTADYCGFFHYRRYLSFDREFLIEEDYKKKLPKPYVTYDNLSKEVLDGIFLNEDSMKELIKEYDILVPIRERNNCSVYEQYKTSKYHNIKDLDIVIKVIKEKYPEFVDAMNIYLNDTMNYYCNMYIMKKDIFDKYCTWMFDILAEHEEQSDLSDYSVEEYRVSGFLSERLFGIYYTYLKQLGNYKCAELQRIEFRNTDPKTELKPVFEPAKCVPIVLSANDDFAPYLATMIQSIIHNSNENNDYDIIILNKDISDINKKSILKISSGFKNVSIRFYNISELIEDRKFFVDKHLSIETYFRLLIQDIMVDYGKILYLDCDMVVEEDVALLYNENIEGYLLAAVKDIDYAGVYKLEEERRKYTKDILKLSKPFDYFQAGVLLINLDEFRKKFTVEELLDVATSYKWKHHDQDVLNHLCEGNVKFLDMSWNVVMNWESNFSSRMDVLKNAPRYLYNEYMNSRKKPKIIHYAGYQKPWNELRCDYSDDFWKYARETYFYEEILKNLFGNNNSFESKKVKNGEKAYKMKGMNKTLFVDMKKINSWFPPSSKRRILVKNIAKILYK